MGAMVMETTQVAYKLDSQASGAMVGGQSHHRDNKDSGNKDVRNNNAH